LLERPPRLREAVSEPPEVLLARRAERIESVPPADEPPQQPRVHRLTAEPEPPAVGPVRLRLCVDVVEAVVAPFEARRRVVPQRLPRLEVLVEQFAALLERHAERL